MSCGDLNNSLRILQKELKLVRYTVDLDFDLIKEGSPNAYLPIYNYLLMHFSKYVASEINEHSIEVLGLSDARFVDALYKIFRELYKFKMPLTKDQFFSKGFVEKKMMMCAQIATKTRERHQSLAPKAPIVIPKAPGGTSGIKANFAKNAKDKNMNSSRLSSTMFEKSALPETKVDVKVTKHFPFKELDVNGDSVRSETSKFDRSLKLNKASKFDKGLKMEKTANVERTSMGIQTEIIPEKPCKCEELWAEFKNWQKKVEDRLILLENQKLLAQPKPKYDAAMYDDSSEQADDNFKIPESSSLEVSPQNVIKKDIVIESIQDESPDLQFQRISNFTSF
ncbi:DgyrCDS11695 [Dimorphilus gyrociliatus]|uniref:Centrosomal protein of 44 kDa n=1 Tax=Dimorphilus gyrociliatus TaxID=2664684 RepID=A0A7I8W5G5_9ANNE|nr:DgyrCDS11695 [Dimorphilus gyrociliatus]